MPVTPSHATRFQDRQDLHQFLLACQQKAAGKNYSQIVSISLEINPVELLAVFQENALETQPNFYFEKSFSGEAIAAFGSAIELQVDGQRRFTLAQDFIRSGLERTTSTGVLHLPFAGPHFFCSFGFFDTNLKEDSPFPPATIFLPRWQVARRNGTYVFVANIAIAPDIDIETTCESTWQILQKLRGSTYSSWEFSAQNTKHFKPWKIEQPQSLKTAVIDALKSIQLNRYSKIVLAHASEVKAKKPFNIAHSLNNLRRLHPDCYIFATTNGQGKTFIGASPERLVSIHHQILETDALAGSAPRGKTPHKDSDLAKALLKSEKERREHQVVIDFIVKQLSNLGLTPQLSLPRLLPLSNIQHLWTPIQARVPSDVHILKILAELHPTPAVAGDPREIACAEIRRYETFERSLYAAPLGWIDHQGNGEFVVGIRSAIIECDRARLYAGAGIVAGSDPDKELAEIQLKLQALLKALV